MTERKFHFRLEPVRMIRKEIERAVMKDLASEIESADRLRTELRLVEERLEAAHRAPAAPATAHELAAQQAYRECVERRRGEVEALVERQDRNLEHTRRRLADATTRRSMLDQLEERRRAAHEDEARRAGAVEANETSLLGFLRRDVAL